MADILPLTTNRTIAQALRESLRLRGAAAGQTFGDFIEACRALGIRDGDPLGSIEYGVAQMGTGRIVFEVNEDGVEIREVL